MERGLLGNELKPAVTFGREIEYSLERNPNRVQYVTPDGKEITAFEFVEMSRAAARSLISLDVKPRDGVAIIGANSLEWFIADVGTVLAAAIPTGIYVTNHVDVVAHILNNAQCTVAFASSQTDLLKLVSAKPQCPSLRTIIYWGSDVDLSEFPDHKDYILSWNEFIALGDSDVDSYNDEMKSRLDSVKAIDCCKLIFTSGTTGMPKAVMISHANFCAAVYAVKELLSVTDEDVAVSYLPASHIAANTLDIGGGVMTDQRIHIAPEDALRGSLVDTLRKVRPTLFLGVPRVWEKIRERMLAIGATRGAVARLISNIAKSIGAAACDAEDENEPLPYGITLMERYVFSSIRTALGLDRCRMYFNSTAPLLEITDDYFRSLHMRIYDLYGASEATGPLTSNMPGAYKRGTSGKPFPGVEAKVYNPDSTGEGELCFRARHIFMGYLGNEEESKKVLDEDGFYHSGDLGRIDEDGYVSITGRLKELLITSAGENVAPLLAENAIVNAIPGIARAFAVGDKRKFVSCLLVPYLNEKGELTGISKDVNPALTFPSEAINDEKWAKYLEEGMARANETAISNAAKVKKWRLLERDFTVEKNELTPSLKVKRKICLQNFADVVDEIYAV